MNYNLNLFYKIAFWISLIGLIAIITNQFSTQNIICRFEGQWLNSRDEIFDTKTTSSKDNFIIGSFMAVRFGR